jgi:Domian of unknown function (DUF4952)
MKRIVMLAIVVGLLLNAKAFAATSTCDDFLKLAKRKPDRLEFVECKPSDHHQLRALVATYRVPGEHAGSVESYLSRRTKMAKLRFVCCGWEPSARASPRLGRLPIAIGESNEVTMSSMETLVTKRWRWKEIEWFYVTVTVYLESP